MSQAKTVKNQRRSSANSDSDSINVLLLGVGNMGSSLVKGLLASTLGKAIKLRLHDQHLDRLKVYASDPRVKILETLPGVKNFSDDIILICTKPQDLPAVAQNLAGKIQDRALVISILAAVTTDDIAAQLKFKGAIVRAMPNIAATVGEAALPCAAIAIVATT
ncbi:MAG: NAD(P)-binding domain-containing protein [Proteobacteria bacterium]|nr:NAD(P)-binding domain-containing protein [Pseudomonadota bacterium]